MNSILKSWHQKGLHTLAQIEAEDSAYRRGAPAAGASPVAKAASGDADRRAAGRYGSGCAASWRTKAGGGRDNRCMRAAFCAGVRPAGKHPDQSAELLEKKALGGLEQKCPRSGRSTGS
jgi:hypothetical protein